MTCHGRREIFNALATEDAAGNSTAVGGGIVGGELQRFTVFPDFNNGMAVRVFTLVGVYTCCVLLFRR